MLGNAWVPFGLVCQMARIHCDSFLKTTFRFCMIRDTIFYDWGEPRESVCFRVSYECFLLDGIGFLKDHAFMNTYECFLLDGIDGLKDHVLINTPIRRFVVQCEES